MIKVIEEFEKIIKGGIGLEEKIGALMERIKVMRNEGLIKDEIYEMMKVHLLYKNEGRKNLSFIASFRR